MGGHSFNLRAVAKFDQKRIEQLLLDPSIIRNRLKVEAAVNNAKQFLLVQKEFGSFDAYCWQFVGGRPIVNKHKTQATIPSTSAESEAMSKDLKKRGFKFVGPTVIYAHMQAVGMINDHLLTCFRHKQVKQG